MAETMALAIIRPLVGLLRNEAKLLRGIRGDVQFIKDEMESVQGFLENQNLARNCDRQVRAWVEQVMELAYDSKNCVVDYAQCGRRGPRGRGGRGLVRRIKWALRLPRRVLVRHRIAARIRQLKDRARDVGERQQRYAVTVQRSSNTDATTTTGVVTVDDWNDPQAAGGRRAQDHRQPSTRLAHDSVRSAVFSGPDLMTEAKVELLRWLAEKRPEDHRTKQWPSVLAVATPLPSVLAVVTPDGVDGTSLANQVYNHCQNPSSEDHKFDCTVRITIRHPLCNLVVLLDMLSQLHHKDNFESMGKRVETLKQTTQKLRETLRGKRFLLVISDLDDPEIWSDIKKTLEKLKCSSGSSVVIFTKDEKVAGKCSPDKTKVYSLADFYYKKAEFLVRGRFRPEEELPLQKAIREIVKKCTTDAYCRNLFFDALLSNPNRTVKELEHLSRSLVTTQSPPKIENQSTMLMFCYHGLSKDYQNCLWYSAAFTRGTFMVQRTSLLRRWVAEGLIKSLGKYYTEEAERCFDALVTQKLIHSREVDSTGNIKTCGVNPLFASKITDSAADEAFLDTNLPADLELHFSIRNGIQIRRTMELNSTTAESIVPLKNKKIQQEMKMMAFLNHLPSSSSFRLLRVLELEGFKGFKKCHLKNICKIHQLKYLSLRDTDVVQLPKEIDKLEQLETLDIRGTEVQELNAVLPMLKHLLAGRIDYTSGKGDTVKSNELFTTVGMPKYVSKMDKLEILSHVKVHRSGKELADVGEKLVKLRKLGVVLCGKKANLNDSFHQIDELYKSLVSLSIRVEQPVKWDADDDATLTPPRFLKSLTICDVKGWMPARIKELHHLVKITLRGTKLKEGHLAILGSLGSLLCLRLRYHSFAEAALVFEKDQFRRLMELVIEDDNLRSLTFALGTAPKLNKMVWSFTRLELITGVKNLVNLRHLELNGGRCELTDGLEALRNDISPQCKDVRFNLSPPEKNGADAAVRAH